MRLYTTAFMAWLAIVFFWFLATVLRDRRDFFAFGALVGGFAMIVCLNALNPDALIVRTNAALASNPINSRAFDAPYGTSLSADAVPELIASLPLLDPDRQRTTALALLREENWPEERDWRAWNYARWSAWDVIEANRAQLEGYARLR